MALMQELFLLSMTLLLSTVSVQSQNTYTTTTSSSTLCRYTAYRYNYIYSQYYSYAAYKYCSYGCCGYSYKYCCYSYSNFSYVYHALSSSAIAGIVIGCLAAGGVVLAIVICIICAARSRSRPAMGGMVLQPNQTTAAVNVSTHAQNGGQPGFLYPVSPQPFTIQPNTRMSSPLQPGVAPPYQPMTGGLTNAAFSSGPEAGVDSKASAPPPTYSEAIGDNATFSTQ